MARSALATCSPALGAVAALAGGAAAREAALLEAEQLREERENARVAAEQQEAFRRRDLARTLASIETQRAGRGLDLFSGSGLNLRDMSIAEAEKDINTLRLNSLTRMNRFLIGAEQAELKGTTSLLGGVGGAATALAPTRLRRDRDER